MSQRTTKEERERYKLARRWHRLESMIEPLKQRICFSRYSILVVEKTLRRCDEQGTLGLVKDAYYMRSELDRLRRALRGEFLISSQNIKAI